MALPEAYVKSLGLKSGDRVEIYFNDYLHIKPIKTKLER
ncbi:MAG: AbrB/MazE/SpoVT family DNA-binding domain-containing protein [Candidatus Baldrarchaeia archaeon]